MKLVDDGVNFITFVFSIGHNKWYAERKGGRTEYERAVFVRNLPDYLNDLNAMHEAEATLRLDVYYEYTKELYIVCEGRTGFRGYTFAAADQRAEAFLKTIEKWEENDIDEYNTYTTFNGVKLYDSDDIK